MGGAEKLGRVDLYEHAPSFIFATTNLGISKNERTEAVTGTSARHQWHVTCTDRRGREVHAGRGVPFAAAALEH